MNVPTEFLTGAAGAGKTFEIKRRIECDPSYAVLAATTGVAALNLGTVTINSILGYFDTDSLQDRYTSGRLHRTLRRLYTVEDVRNVVIDEVSMLHAEQLDIIHMAIREVNAGDDLHAPLSPPLGLVLTGDFCQLPPVKGRWAFKADCWPEFAANITRLTKVSRHGMGMESARALRSLNAQFDVSSQMNFDGTTIVAKNVEADRYNSMRLIQVRAPSFALTNNRWGIESPDWKNIPDRLILKEGALVMILSNNRKGETEGGGFNYVNGDLAHVVSHNNDGAADGALGSVRVRLLRDDSEHLIGRISRENTSRNEPDEATLARCIGKAPYYDEGRKKWVLGAADYWPLRLGYASTVHKSQGLSLDRIQLDMRDGFFGAPSMAYVAISRCRTVGGLRIVGTPDVFAKRVNLDSAVKEWL
jgi:hypothetical protein